MRRVKFSAAEQLVFGIFKREAVECGRGLGARLGGRVAPKKHMRLRRVVLDLCSEV